MGAPRVGKSTLVNQFLWEIFVPDYRPTVGGARWKKKLFF
jgi:GTPase SAR1 family protein